MKRLITSSRNTITSNSRFGSKYIINDWNNQKGHNYSVKVYNEDDPSQLQIKVAGLHPYDDAYYAWARVESFNPTVAQIINNGEFLASVKMEPYDAQKWSSTQDYVDEFVDNIIAELENVNKDVEPKLIHF